MTKAQVCDIVSFPCLVAYFDIADGENPSPIWLDSVDLEYALSELSSSIPIAMTSECQSVVDLRKAAQDEEKEAFLAVPLTNDHVPRSSKEATRRNAIRYARLALEVMMAIAIIILLARSVDDGQMPISKAKLSPVPTFPRKTYTFAEEPRYLHEKMFFNKTETLRTLHNWIELSSDSRGYVQFQDADSYDLPSPYITPVNRTSDGPGYMVSLYHQLHCLSYLVEHFQVGYSGVELTDEIAHHSSHCFDYLRQAIMCAADTTLEGDTEYGPGWGSKHECKDYDAVLQWANEHATMRWRTNMPDESTL